MLVCPTAGDQFQNAHKAEELGVGMWVDRPEAKNCHSDECLRTAAAYRADVAAKLQQISEHHQSFKKACHKTKQELSSAGGVPRAVGVVLETAGCRT